MRTIIVILLVLCTVPAQARHRHMRRSVPVSTPGWFNTGAPWDVFAPSPAHTPATGSQNVVRSRSGAHATVASSASGAFQCVIDALERQGYAVRFMGGLSAGHMRNSLHHAGLALDINQTSRNRTTPHMPPNEIALANSCGLVSGAQWAHGDSGHFQVGGWAGRSRRYAAR